MAGLLDTGGMGLLPSNIEQDVPINGRKWDYPVWAYPAMYGINMNPAGLWDRPVAGTTPRTPLGPNIEDRRYMTSPNNPFMKAADRFSQTGGYYIDPERRALLASIALLRDEARQRNR